MMMNVATLPHSLFTLAIENEQTGSSTATSENYRLMATGFEDHSRAAET